MIKHILLYCILSNTARISKNVRSADCVQRDRHIVSQSAMRMLLEKRAIFEQKNRISKTPVNE